MTAIECVQRNGLELEILEGIGSAVRAQPQAGSVTIHSRHRWDDGLAVDGRAHEIENAGEVTTRAFTFRTDWPSDVGGRDLERIGALAARTSAVFNSLAHPIPI